MRPRLLALADPARLHVLAGPLKLRKVNAASPEDPVFPRNRLTQHPCAQPLYESRERRLKISLAQTGHNLLLARGTALPV
jgi:hypothetical protein